MYGPVRLPSREYADYLVRTFVSGHRTPPETMQAIAERIATTGSCVLHAVSEVMGTPCWGFCCKPEVRS